MIFPMFRGWRKIAGRTQQQQWPIRSLSVSTPSSMMERQLQIGSHKINFVEAGGSPNSEKGVILLPGALGTAWTDFKPQIEQLPALLPGHKVIAWDPPGYGKSRPPEKEFGLDFYERDAEAAASLMEKIGFRSFSVLGWSDGGITGLIIAGRKPEQVEKLVIWGSNAYISPKEAGIYDDIRDVSKWSARMREPMEKVYGVEGFPKIWSAWVDGMINIYKQRNGDICKEVLGVVTSRIGSRTDPRPAELTRAPKPANIFFSRSIRSTSHYARSFVETSFTRLAMPSRPTPTTGSAQSGATQAGVCESEPVISLALNATTNPN